MQDHAMGWHFTGDKLRDGSPIPQVGEWLIHDGDVVICESGLHASLHPFDALQYAPGAILHKVECADIVSSQHDKFVCRRRKIIASHDVTELLYAFACDQALSVIHLWDAPDVVRQYLQTRDPSLRDAAWAASAAAWAVWAARDAVWAARDAVWAAWAARDAVWAARDAAWAAMDARTAAKEAGAAGAAWAARNNFLLTVEEIFK